MDGRLARSFLRTVVRSRKCQICRRYLLARKDKTGDKIAKKRHHFNMFSLDAFGPVVRISLNNPDARNAISIARWDHLHAAIGQVAASDARALILRSAGAGIFCAGADISELEQLATDAGLRRRFREAMVRTFDALALLPIATIAAIDGGCYGAGVALALACDIRIAGDEAAFGITPAKLGIAYPAGDVARLQRLIGPGHSARLLYSGMTVKADEAQFIGLVEERVADADKAAMALATTIAANSPTSVASLKRVLAGDAMADRLFDEAFEGPDFRRGVAAFRARRKPEF